MMAVNTGDSTLRSALAAAEAHLRAAGIEQPRRDARLLLAAAIGERPEVVLGYPERSLSAAQAAILESLLSRRARREPVSRIVGQREFWSLPFRLSSATLDPRPESEILVEAILQHLVGLEENITILDLGTGTGCLLLALLQERPTAAGTGVDKDEAALSIARENAGILGLEDRASFVTGNWASEISGSWQVIVSNPPYIKEADLGLLDPEVRDFDPNLALNGGPDGLVAYRRLIPQAAKLLAPDGVLALEIGQGQGNAVVDLLQQAGLEVDGRFHDLAGIERCLVAKAGGGQPQKQICED